MTRENSYLVDYRIIPLTRDYGPYMRGAVWADPDVAQAAQFIRQVALDRTAAADKGRLARRDIEATRTPALSGAGMRARLDALRASDGAPR
jgi:hypothetical protein